jgi:hypothetical protein
MFAPFCRIGNTGDAAVARHPLAPPPPTALIEPPIHTEQLVLSDSRPGAPGPRALDYYLCLRENLHRLTYSILNRASLHSLFSLQRYILLSRSLILLSANLNSI